jgi:DMSO reductase anchor subunit
MTDAKEITPKSGFLTTAFVLWLSTFLVGGALSYLISRGLSKDVAEANRPLLEQMVAQLLPLLWLAVSAWLGRAVIRTREIVTRAKAEAMLVTLRAETRADHPIS